MDLVTPTARQRAQVNGLRINEVVRTEVCVPDCEKRAFNRHVLWVTDQVTD